MPGSNKSNKHSPGLEVEWWPAACATHIFEPHFIELPCTLCSSTLVFSLLTQLQKVILSSALIFIIWKCHHDRETNSFAQFLGKDAPGEIFAFLVTQFVKVFQHLDNCTLTRHGTNSCCTIEARIIHSWKAGN